jgi:hypothetical protein
MRAYGDGGHDTCPPLVDLAWVSEKEIEVYLAAEEKIVLQPERSSMRLTVMLRTQEKLTATVELRLRLLAPQALIMSVINLYTAVEHLRWDLGMQDMRLRGSGA